MADVKINQLPNKTSLADTDVIIVESATQTHKMTIASFRDLSGLAKKSQGGWINIAPRNGWVLGSVGYCRVFLDEFNIVHLEVRIEGGTTTSGTEILRLPSGYYRSTYLYVSGYSAGQLQLFEIRASGGVHLVGGSSSNLIFNISFRLDV